MWVRIAKANEGRRKRRVFLRSLQHRLDNQGYPGRGSDIPVRINKTKPKPEMATLDSGFVP